MNIELLIICAYILVVFILAFFKAKNQSSEVFLAGKSLAPRSQFSIIATEVNYTYFYWNSAFSFDDFNLSMFMWALFLKIHHRKIFDSKILQSRLFWL